MQIQLIIYKIIKKVSVILLDLHLPDRRALINGLLSCNRIPIIILTGSDLTIKQKSLQIGVYDYLIREINPDTS
jgi:DNA-binding response OmpR family regulator